MDKCINFLLLFPYNLILKIYFCCWCNLMFSGWLDPPLHLFSNLLVLCRGCGDAVDLKLQVICRVIFYVGCASALLLYVDEAVINTSEESENKLNIWWNKRCSPLPDHHLRVIWLQRGMWLV